MKYVVFSDVHGNIGSIKLFRDGMVGFSRDKIICLGDIVNRGIDFADNRVVEAVRELKAQCVKGNHEEELSDKDGLKIHPPNLEFLLGLGARLQFGNILCYHSSDRVHGKRLLGKQDISNEAMHIKEGYHGVSFVFYGHTHEAAVYAYDEKKGTVSSLDLDKKMQLEHGKLHLINPGGLGLYHNLPNTFMVFDGAMSELYFYTIGQLEDMAARRDIICSFEEDWMPHLRGDNWSWCSLKREAGEIADRSNKNRRFNSVIKVMMNHNPRRDMPQRKKKQYFNEYSLELARAVQQIATEDVMKHYRLDYPLKTREFYLSMAKKDVRGVECYSHLRIAK